jgi:hypothetical protein
LSLAEHEQFWGVFDAAPATKAIIARWLEAIESSRISEIWEAV